MDQVLLASSGRTALCAALQAFGAASARSVVVVPAYTCYEVAAAAVRAGLRVRLCDVDPETLDLEPDALRRALRDDVLAVVVAGLYGLPARVPLARKAAESAGARVVDDAAQCFGAALDGRACGSLGHCGITSFGRGKSLSTYEGGALFTKDAALAQRARSFLPRGSPGPAVRFGLALKSLGYSVFQHPRLYAWIVRLPGLGLGRTVFDPAFELRGITLLQAALGSDALERFDDVAQARNQRAARYLRDLAGSSDLRLPRVADGAQPVWTRFPLLVPDRARRAAILDASSSEGLGVSASYPAALSSLEALRPHLAEDNVACPGAEWIAQAVITLPTHPAVRPEHQDRILHLLLG